MVNVTGGTKGCNTCRRRKKGCDLNRPHCLRCTRDGRLCEGYERQTKFICHVPVHPTGSRSTQLKAFRSSFEHRLPSSRSNPPSEAVVLHPGLARGAFGDLSLSLWWNSYLPRADAFASQQILPAPSVRRLWCAAWADTITRMSTHNAMLRKAAYALSLSCDGCKRQDQTFVREGVRYYCEALVELRDALQNPVVAAEDESLLPTCLLLADYEFFNGFMLLKEPPLGKGWRAHVDGIGRLLSLRGPQKHISSDAFVIFSGCRKMQFGLCFGYRKASSLESVEWSSIPGMGEEKVLKERLHDVLMPIPGLLERFDSTEESSHEERQCVLQELVLAYQRLRNWKAELDIQLFGIDGYSSPESLLRFGISAVDSVLLYWSVCVVLYTTIKTMQARHPFNSACHFKDDVFISPDPDANWRNILKFIRYFIRPEAGLAGFTNVLTPVGILCRFCAPSDKRCKEELLKEINTLLDVNISGQLGQVMGGLLLRMSKYIDTLQAGGTNSRIPT